MGLKSRSSKASKTKQKAKEVDVKPDLNEQQAQQQQQQRKYLVQRVFNSDIEISPEDAVDAVHWMRQLMAVVVGIFYGVLQLTGFPAILSFFGLILIAPSAILSFFHELDFEEINKHKNIQGEGVLPSMALFILSWTLSYTVFLPQST